MRATRGWHPPPAAADASIGEPGARARFCLPSTSLRSSSSISAKRIPSSPISNERPLRMSASSFLYERNRARRAAALRVSRARGVFVCV